MSNFTRDQDSFLDLLLQVQWSLKLEQRILDDSLAFSKDEGICIFLKYLKNTVSTLKRLKHKTRQLREKILLKLCF